VCAVEGLGFRQVAPASRRVAEGAALGFAVERGRHNLNSFKHFHLKHAKAKPRPESGLDCLRCAVRGLGFRGMVPASRRVAEGAASWGSGSSV